MLINSACYGLTDMLLQLSILIDFEKWKKHMPFIERDIFCLLFSVLITLWRNPPGNYSYSQKGEELVNGQNASITWNVNIKNRHDAIVTISSWHASFTCEGSYVLSNIQGHIALSWVAERNVRTECDLPAPQIVMKRSSSGAILIHSQLFPWESEGWYKTRKIK